MSQSRVPCTNGGSSSHEPEEMVHNMQIQAVQQRGNMLGHSNSLNAADMMRWRDIAFNADPENTYGDVAAAAMEAMALAGRKSDGGADAGIDGRRQSLSLATRMAVGCSPRLPPSSVISGPPISRNNSSFQTGSPGNFSAMSREELFASLQASAQRLNRIGSFTQQQQHSSRANSPSAGGSSHHWTSASGSQQPKSPHSPQHPGLFQRSQSSSLVDSPPLSPSRMAPGRPPSGGGISDVSVLRAYGDSPHMATSGGGGRGPLQHPQQQGGLRTSPSLGPAGVAPHHMMPSRLNSSSFSVPNSPMVQLSGPSGLNRLSQLRPVPPDGMPLSPGGVSPRTSSFSAKMATRGGSVGSSDVMQPPAQMVIEGRDFSLPRDLDAEMDAIISAAEGAPRGPDGGLFGGIKNAFRS